MSAAPVGTQWTPQLVEDLIARQFLHNQDVSSMKPPAPLAPRSGNQQANVTTATKGGAPTTQQPFSEATKQYMRFFNQQSGSSTPPPQNQNVAPFAASPSTKTAGAAASTAASPRMVNVAAAAVGNNITQQQAHFTSPSPQLPSPQSKVAQQQQQGMFPVSSSSTTTAVGGVPPSPSSHHANQQQLQQLQQIQQQLHQQPQQQQQQQQQPVVNTMMMASGVAGHHYQQQQQQLSSPAALQQRQTDCVNSCKALAASIQFPPHIPSNNHLMARPDPANPKKSLCPPAQLTAARIVAQQGVDPDLIFAQPIDEFPLQKIFQQYPDALKVVANARGGSGDWRSDTFSREEEAIYKREMRFEAVGPYQARPNNFGGLI